MAESVGQLEYAAGPAWHQRREVRRVVLAVVLVGCALASVRWLEAGWGHAKLLYWQGKCLGYTAPVGKLIDRGGKVTSVKEWEEFYALLSPPGRKAAAVVFLGEMRRKDGGRRLVAVEYAAGDSVSAGVIRIDYHVIEPGGLWVRPRLVTHEFGTAAAWGFARTEDIKHFAGQRDPIDPSHFTMRFEIGGKTTSHASARIIDAWLQENDTVLFEGRTTESR